MLRRTWHLVRARMALARAGGWPVHALVFLATLAALLVLLVRDALPPFPYALFALGVGALVLAPPLFSDLGVLLRHDEGGEWVRSLPVRERELTLARALHVLAFLAALALAWFVPWALLAPEGTSLGMRLGLVPAGLGLALLEAAAVIWAQQFLLRRLEGALVLVETAMMAAVVFGLMRLLGNLPELARLDGGESFLRWIPAAWFARPLAEGARALPLPALAAALGGLSLLAVPIAAGPSPRRTSWLERALEPLHRAADAWVRPGERGAFELVWRALPREREVALRTFPMLGIPLAFLWVGATSEESDAWRGDLLALLLVTVGIYLPVLLVHVPLSESARAAWLLRTAPQPAAAHEGGAIKALFARWLLPLYVALLAVGLWLGEGGLLLRLWLPSVLLSLVLLRLLYPRCVGDLPLSVPPEGLGGGVDWAGLALPLAIGLTLAAAFANRFLTVSGGLSIALFLLALEILGERARRRPEERDRRTPGD